MHDFAEYVQTRSNDEDRLILLAAVLAHRTEDGIFQAVSVNQLCDDLRLPRLANPSSTLSRAAKKGLTRTYPSRGWSLTPVGQRYSSELLGDVGQYSFSPRPAMAFSELAHTKHLLIPPEMAPTRWSAGIQRMLERYPFDNNVFCMARFPKRAEPLSAAILELKKVFEENGLTLHLASDRQFDDDLLGNVGAYMWACRYGIGVAEDQAGLGLNVNLAIELGSMVMTGRRCALLKDKTAPALPTDLAGHIYKPIDLTNLKSVKEAAQHWITEDLGR